MARRIAQELVAAVEREATASFTIKFFGEKPPYEIAVETSGAIEKVRNSDITRANAEVFRKHFQEMQRVRAKLSGNRLDREFKQELVRTKD